MNILFVASEVAPFAKAGGLGDVSAALPRALHDAGHTVRVMVPMYSRVQAPGRVFTTVLPEASFQMGPRRVTFSVHSCPLPGSTLPVYFVRCPALYDRPGIYTSDPDEHIRFAVLSYAALKTAQLMQFRPDIVHANDWQTALLPLMTKTLFSWDRLFDRTRSVLTIHNIGHQGAFESRVVEELGLGPVAKYLHQDQLRAGRLNFLLTGLLYANALTTVSPTYAREIQTEAHGVGLHPFLRERRDSLYGILNGIDEAVWSPERDVHLAQRYSAGSLEDKERNKRALMEATRMPYASDVPVVGVVSRLVWQKGFDLCQQVLPEFLQRNPVQLVVLGTGEEKYERFFSSLAGAFPRRVAYKRGFSERLAHLIEGGSDLFLMPSRYEPCGLNQMYSLRYGTLPIVHKTGGLADTVDPVDTQRGTGTGFVFDHFNAAGLRWALGHAMATWGSGTGFDRKRWRHFQANGMSQPFSWTRRVSEFEALYRKVLSS